MNKHLPNFDVGDKRYTHEYTWSLSQQQKPGKPVFVCAKQPSHMSFMVSKNFGFMISEDYNNNSTLSELNTSGMQVTSADYCLSSEQQILISFSTGHILLINPLLRRRGPVVWLNTKKNIYSSRAPTVARWLDEHQFLVMFDDGLMWKFDKRLSGEDDKFIQAAQNNARESRNQVVCIPHPSPEANPVLMWKFRIGRVRDIQLGSKAKKNLLCIVTEKDIRIMDVENSTILATLKSYFAGFQCACWSEDSSLVLAGGEDDCLHVWNTTSWALVCKGIGHNSWISSVLCEKGENGLSAVTVGHDGKICFWENFPQINEGAAEKEIVEYPKKSEQHIIEPINELKISEDPIMFVHSHNKSYFLCDIYGNILKWV